MTKEQLAEIKARCEAATPGDWYLSGSIDALGNGLQIVTINENGREITIIDDGSAGGEYGAEANFQDMEFITHARQDIPALIEAIEAQARTVEALYRDCENCIAFAQRHFTNEEEVK